MAITYNEIQYGPFGRCMQMTNGIIELVVTLDMGPRIIRYALAGGENVFCEAPDVTVPENGFKILGGHRLWHSPESMPRTYELQDKPVEYEKIENGLRVAQDVEPWAGMAKEMEITLDPDDAGVNVLHRIRNCNAWPVEFGIWALSVMAAGGRTVMPIENTGDFYTEQRVLSVWANSSLGDPRLWMSGKYITLTQDTQNAAPIKIGYNNDHAWAAYFNQGQVFIKQFGYFEGKKYPDNGCSYETYTNDFMLEMESLSPLQRVEPGDEIEHLEYWYLLDGVDMPANTDEAIDLIVDDLFGEGCGCDCGGCGGCGTVEDDYDDMDDLDACGCHDDHDDCCGEGCGGCGGGCEPGE